jgi:hypothetical protein
MPTGYTADVIEKDISFREFALKCMRAFGALVSFRDDDSNKIITEVPMDAYREDSLNKAKVELATFEEMSHEEAKAEARTAILDEGVRSTKAHKDALKENFRLLKMREQVKAWNPPTPEHTRYKEFMLDQLTMSLHDMKYYKVVEPDLSDESIEMWIQKRNDYLKYNVGYSSKNLTEAIERNKEANAWIKSIVDSLPQEEA